MSALIDLQNEIQSLVGPVARATVSLGRDGRATGIVVAAGTVLTNAHAVRDRTIQVRFHDGRTVQGTVAGTDPEGDLAVIQVDTADMEPLQWSEITAVPGSLIVSGHGHSGVSMGLVTSQHRRFRGPRGRIVTDAFEHNAPLNRGASGGPVVGMDGCLLGINTARTDAGYQAVANSSDLRNRIASLTAGEMVDRPTLGIAVVDPAVARRVRSAAGLPERDGVLVSAVADDSPSAKAGLSKGDLIVAIDGVATSSIDDVQMALNGSPASVTLAVVRGTEERSVLVSFQQ